MYAPEHELRAAEVRREYLGEHAGFEALPNTTIAVAAVASILGRDDPEEVANAARRVSKATAEEIRELTVTLANNEVELDLSDIRPETGVQPPKARAIVEFLDAASEVPRRTVTVRGFLRGANSRGEGTFEIETDPDGDLDPTLGPRRKPGDVIGGRLTPRTRGEIREHNLWDSYVEARVQVIRRQHGNSMEIVGFRLISVKPWQR